MSDSVAHSRLGSVARSGCAMLAVLWVVACSSRTSSKHTTETPDGGAGAGGAGGSAGAGQCATDARRCDGITPQVCSSSGVWTSEAACAGSAPICNPSSGVCTAMLVTGGITSVPRSSAAGGARLREANISQTRHTCAAGICVSGGIRP